MRLLALAVRIVCCCQCCDICDTANVRWNLRCDTWFLWCNFFHCLVSTIGWIRLFIEIQEVKEAYCQAARSLCIYKTADGCKLFRQLNSFQFVLLLFARIFVNSRFDLPLVTHKSYMLIRNELFTKLLAAMKKSSLPRDWQVTISCSSHSYFLAGDACISKCAMCLYMLFWRAL